MEPFEFELSLDNQTIQRNGDLFELRGTLRHFGSEPIVFGSEPYPLQLGFFVNAPDGSTRIFEDRARLEASRLYPSTAYKFRLIIPPSLAQKGSILINIDLLYEDLFWFHQHTQRIFACQVALASEEILSVEGIAPTGEESDEVERQLIDASLRLHAFQNYSAIEFLSAERIDKKFGKFPTYDLAVFNEPFDAQQTRLSPSRLMVHLAEMRNRAFLSRIGKTSNRFDLIMWSMKILGEFLEDTQHLIPDHIVNFLNEKPIDDGVFEIPMSRLMVWFWLKEGRKLDIKMLNDREQIYWWWVTGVMPANSLPASLISEDVKSYLSAPHERFRSRQIPLSRFFVRAYEESPQLQNRYDLTTDEGLFAYSFDVLIHNLSSPINRNLVGSAQMGFWASPLSTKNPRVTKFEYALSTQVPELRDQIGDLEPDSLEKLLSIRLRRRIVDARPEWSELLNMPIAHQAGHERATQHRSSSSMLSDTARVAVAGMFSSTSGLGVNARMSQKVLANCTSNLISLDTDTIERYSTPQKDAPSVSLIHLNADAVPSIIIRDRAGVLRQSHRIGFFLWELEELPSAHRLGIDLVDEIWVPTEFLREVYSQATDKPVRLVKKYILVPEFKRSVRSDGIYRFLTSFDFHSGVERKNPLAVVRAFLAAFPPNRDDVRLIVKTTEFVPGHWGDPNDQWPQIIDLARSDARIEIVTDWLSDRGMFELIDSADCIVSAHRAEGFGYLPAYGMYLGKDVIATDYSGTRDFCLQETSLPISFRLRDVAPGEFIVDVPKAKWADVDLNHLVEAMQQVVDHKELGERRRTAGSQLIKNIYSLTAQAQRYVSALGMSGFKVTH